MCLHYLIIKNGAKTTELNGIMNKCHDVLHDLTIIEFNHCQRIYLHPGTYIAAYIHAKFIIEMQWYKLLQILNTPDSRFKRINYTPYLTHTGLQNITSISNFISG